MTPDLPVWKAADLIHRAAVCLEEALSVLKGVAKIEDPDGPEATYLLSAFKRLQAATETPFNLSGETDATDQRD